MDEINDTEFDESDHNRLISAVSKLDRTQHIKDPTRNEPTHLSSEFNLIKNSGKLDLGNVAKLLENTAKHVSISKKLKKTQDSVKVLPKPLEKPQAERIKRATGYEQTKKIVGRWDPVVARSRTVDYISFPLKHAIYKNQPTSEFLSKFKLKSPLELELAEVDPPAVIEDNYDQEEKQYPMSYQEMLEQRQHLAKMRAQQSFQAAKAKRQSKIKSKKYHRILKKEKLKNQLKEFEELQKTNPEEALNKLEAIEKNRALERHTLRHRNTSKWAKSKLIRAKYDTETRQQLAEQLAVSRGLTRKVQDVDSTDDEADNEVIPDMNLVHDPNNPWMLQQSGKSNIDAEFNFGYKKYLKDKMYKKKDSDDSESEVEEGNEKVVENEHVNVAPTMNSLANFVLKQTASQIKVQEQNTEEEVKPSKVAGKANTNKRKQETKTSLETVHTKKLKKQKTKLVATASWVVESVDEPESRVPVEAKDITKGFENIESNIQAVVEQKLNKIRKNLRKLEAESKRPNKKQTEEKENEDSLEYLKMKNQKKKAVIDEQLLESTSRTAGELQTKAQNELPNRTASNRASKENNAEANIDPSRFIQAKPKYLSSIVPEGDNDIDQLDDDEQVVPRVNIEEVFEEDDVVDSFRQEKEEEEKKDQPEDIDLSLPGWGSWGGKGVKAPRRRKNRFILKAPPKMPRRDENKGDIIIKEYKDPKLSAHKVKEVPFPFNSVKEYEASIRAPIGNTFIPEKAHKLLIRPAVITKAGTVIDPMDEDELLVPRNQSFKNKSVIKLLGKK